jgi:antitoxin component of MazEF toxin-antitoxin module
VTKTISKIGNSQGLIFDTALMQMARLKVGDQVTVSIDEQGSIIITPIRTVIDAEKGAAVAERLVRKNPNLFQRLS